MKATVAAAGTGALFGVGLVLSGMTNPSKPLGFLDVFGAWDPSMAFVMAGAIGVHAVLTRIILRSERPIFGSKFDLPTKTNLDAELLGGAALFGVGWGLGGYCPGPALVSLATESIGVLVFVAAMTAGMLLYQVTRPAPAVPSPATR